MASHDSLGPRTRARVTARPMNRGPDFFEHPRLSYQCEGILLIDRCRVRSRAMAARYRKAASGRVPMIRKRTGECLLLRSHKATISTRATPASDCLLTLRLRRALLPMRPLADEDTCEG